MDFGLGENAGDIVTSTRRRKNRLPKTVVDPLPDSELRVKGSL